MGLDTAYSVFSISRGKRNIYVQEYKKRDFWHLRNSRPIKSRWKMGIEEKSFGYLTDHFTILEPHNLLIGKIYDVQKRGPNDFVALKVSNVRSGKRTTGRSTYASACSAVVFLPHHE